ncbi:protease modulator HflC [bacterium]
MKKFPIIFMLFILVMIIFSAAFIVKETEQVVITQFGKPIGQPIVKPGIHFKVPIIQKAHFFDRRFLAWDGFPNQIPTEDKRFIKVDTYARWRISDPLLFYQRVRDERGAQSRLDDILDGETRNAIAKHILLELIRSENRDPLVSEQSDTKGELLQKIETGRRDIVAEILEAASKRTVELGIELLNIQFKRINYVKEVEEKIFERMIAERKRIADKFRSEGKGAALKILGDKEREWLTIKSKAYKEAEIIRGKSDAKAANIYASAYNQSSESRDFYKFLKTMATYEKVFNEDDILLLATEGDFFRYLKKKSGR